MNRSTFLRSAVAAAALFAAGAASAQAWPTQTIRIVVPYPPGGSSDIIARAISRATSRTYFRSAEPSSPCGVPTAMNTTAESRTALASVAVKFKRFSVRLRRTNSSSPGS